MNRRKKKNRSSAENAKRRSRERYLPDSKSAKASKYIHHLKKYRKKHPDMRVLIYIRESTRAQDHNKNLDTYEKVLRRRLKKLNIPVVGCYREVSSGWILDFDKRGALVNATEDAIKHKAIILAPSADRFLRNKDFHTKHAPNVLPTEAEFKELEKLTCGVPLVTLLHPDMPPKKVRRHQTRWGQQVKGNSGGRPKINKPGYKKKRRLEQLPGVLRRRRKGKSLEDISKATGRPKCCSNIA